MGDRVRIRLPIATLYFGMYPATQVDSAFCPLWHGKISTRQRAVMLCGWGVKAGMACLPAKLCVAISARFRKCIIMLGLFKGALQMPRFTLLFLLLTS